MVQRYAKLQYDAPNSFLDDMAVDNDGSVFASSPQAASDANRTMESDSPSSCDSGSHSQAPDHRSKIGFINYHPTMNGMFGRFKLSCLLSNLPSARPCDSHGNFLNENEQPSLSEPRGHDWAPFADRQQFETAEFLFKRAQMSAGNIDQLLELWTASGDAPFVNHTDLYETIDAIPIGGVPWQSFSVTYNGLRPGTNVPPWMEQTYEVYFRDPRQIFLNMLANPTFAGDFDYMPMQEFGSNGSRRYEHFMSGDWAWKHAVSLTMFVAMASGPPMLIT